MLRQRAFFSGRAAAPGGLPDLAWFTPLGKEMTEADWFAPTAAVGMLLAGTAMSERDACGRPLLDDSFLLLLNAGHEPVPFVLPGTPRAGDGTGYETVVDTAAADGAPAGRHLPGDPVPLGARALHLLRAVP